MHIGICSVPSNFHCRKWAGALAQAGARVTVFSLEGGSVPGAEVANLGPPSGNYRYLHYATTAARLHSEAARRGVDVLHPLHLTPFGSWAVWSGFPRVVGAAIGADVLEFPPRETQGADEASRGWEQLTTRPAGLRATLRHAYFRHQVQRVVGRCAFLTADNQVLVDALTQHFGAEAQRVELLRWGQDFALLDQAPSYAPGVAAKLGLGPNTRIVLSPRGMRPIYQADGVLDAFAALLADGVPQREGVALVMLGAGYAPSPHLAARAHSLAEQYPGLFVFHTQQLSPTEMAGLWHLADVLVNVPIFDGYSAALSEARYMGAIPVVNAIAAHHELLRHGHNALFVPQPFTPAQLAHTLAEALAQREALQARFWAANRQWVKQYANLANNAQEFLALCSRHFSLPQ